jgi:hypothetical protein
MVKAIQTHGVRPLLLPTELQPLPQAMERQPRPQALEHRRQPLLMELRHHLPRMQHLPQRYLLMEIRHQPPMRLPHVPHRMGHRHLSKVSVSSSNILPSKVSVSNLPQSPLHLNKIPIRSGPQRQLALRQLALFLRGVLSTLQIRKRLALDSLLRRGTMEIVTSLFVRTEVESNLAKNRHLLPLPLTQILL